MKQNIETEDTDNPVCPYCGMNQPDVDEREEDEDVIACHNCGELFEYVRICEFRYYTTAWEE